MELNKFIENFASQFEDAEIANIAATTEFKQLETWDSLTAFSVQMMVEDDYNVKLLPQEIKDSKTVEDLFDLIKSKVS